MKLNFTNKLKFISLIILSLLLTACDDRNNNKSNFTITPDTIIEPNSEISKYVTQEEVDSFSFRYWDIDTYEVKNNSTMENFRQILKSKNTTNILNFMKDNNISVDTPLHYGVTPLMYASFYNDENTVKELIKLGADIHKKDKYGLNALAYAISMNSLEVVKLLYNNGVKFEEAPITQGYILAPSYSNIEKLIIDGDNIEIIYKYNYIQKDYDTPKGGGYMFEDVVYKNWLELGKFMLDSGYKPYPYFFTGGDSMFYGNSINDFISQETIDKEIKYTKNNNPDDFNLKLFMDEFSYQYSLYKVLDNIPNHEPMLNLLLEHNVSGQPSEELLKKEYDRCYKENYKDCFKKDNSCRPVFEIYDEIRALNVMYKLFKNYCPDKNGTFKNTKEFIAFKNEDKKEYAISSFKNKNPEKVFINDKNMTLDKLREYEYKNSEDENERNFIKTYYLKTN